MQTVRDRSDRRVRTVGSIADGWGRAARDALVAARGAPMGRRLAVRYLDRLPVGYTAAVTPSRAADDIVALDRLAAARPETDVAARVLPDEGGGPWRLVVYARGHELTLSGFLPMLEGLGLTVVEEVRHRLHPGDGGAEPELRIHDFAVRSEVRPDRGDEARIAEAALAMWHGRAEVDALNRLVLSAGLGWDDVAVLRAYLRYRRQVGTAFSESYLDAALVAHPATAAALVALFSARFDPERVDDPLAIVDARRRVEESLSSVDRLDDDRILRGLLALIEATVRTNRYVTDGSGARPPYLALKLDAGAVPDMPRPVPWREIFVTSPEMEGVHLRAGPVARGGIRWSDRHEDYRTEVLALMRAQVVKNALIVPTGAKGGFVVRRPGPHARPAPAQVREAYRTFIRGLLEVTDNVVDGHVVPPPNVRRHDGDDPYLVVAADRGTATFSDTANEISVQRGFWLSDAFASGGSRGYDHKALGITARGAWLAAARHLRELGVDVQTDPIRVVGIGDMSGDVFGNGLLRSEALRLVAAFDHRHVFLDPDPDPAAAFAERRRLFRLPRSSWADYDQTLISPGGGVWSRDAARIPLSPQVRALLGVDAPELSPPEVIQAILRAPVDLLYAAGIGTFVKATDERHADVGDRANDAVRVDAAEVGARVVVEGGNLAVTPRGRVEYARRGGRINADAVDNAAGVATSDREVNLKVLLALAEADGDLTPAARDGLLDAVAEDVTRAVLRGVDRQTAVVSREAAASPGRMSQYAALLTALEGTGRLWREAEALPDAAELRRRSEAGGGMTRPELAALLGHAKADLAARIAEAGLPDTPVWRAVLCGYFPPLVAERFCGLLHDPRLRTDLVRALVATTVANDLIDRMGIAYAHDTAQELGATPVDVAVAYWAAREVAAAGDLWQRIDELEGRVGPDVVEELHGEVRWLVDALTRAGIRQGETDIDTVIARDRPAFLALAAAARDRLPPTDGRRAARIAAWRREGVDPALASAVGVLPELAVLSDAAAVAQATGWPVGEVAEVFRRLDHALPIPHLEQALVAHQARGVWEQRHRQGLLDDLALVRRAAACQALSAEPSLPPVHAVSRMLGERSVARRRLADVTARLPERAPDLSAIAVAVRALRAVADVAELPDASPRGARSTPASRGPHPTPVPRPRLLTSTAIRGRAVGASPHPAGRESA